MPRRFQAILLASLTAIAAYATPTQTQPDAPTTTPPTLGPVLALDRVGVGRRSSVNTDAIEHAVALGTFTPPTDGQPVTAPDGTIHNWTTVEPDENGNYPPIGGGWAYTTVTAERDSTWIFQGRGHRHVYINGQPRVGDLYNLGITRIPVRLHAGENTFLFKSGRGGLSLAFTPPPAPVFLESRDPTLPTYLRGDTGLVNAGLIITNATHQWQPALRVSATIPGSVVDIQIETAIPTLPPFSCQKVLVQLPPCPPGASTEQPVIVSLQLKIDGSSAGDPVEIKLNARDPNQKHTRTFISSIDGSVQYFGVCPPPEATLETPIEPQSLLLTLHGAGVQGRGQSNAYAPKPGVYIVAPTNRRPFGFDWEDWGRLDAIEVLDIASALFFNADPARTYLSGHSMGGHGTWSLGAYHAGRFAAIAPSAGWRDFWSYGGGAEFETDNDITKLLSRAHNASRTLLMKDNYFDLGVYVLHGDADNNVPPSQARFMRDLLAAAHDNFAYYEQPGAGHWWGNRCVDWPPIFSMFEHSAINPAPHRVDFTTVDPGIASSRAWVTIEQQIKAREPSRVIAEYDAENHEVHVQTTNAAAISLRTDVFTNQEQSDPPALKINSKDQDPAARSFVVSSSGEAVPTELNAAYKSPARNGPFKDAFRNRVLFVVGTQGSPEESAWALAKSRYDAETFWYRGNGSIPITLDTDFDPAAEPDRSVILYGNADTNAAWDALLPDSPIRPEQFGMDLPMAVNDRAEPAHLNTNALACLFARPRPGSDVAMVGVVGGTGPIGMRTTNQLAYFVSGAHFPDWFIAHAHIWKNGQADVSGAGFFAPDWSLGTDLSLNPEHGLTAAP